MSAQDLAYVPTDAERAYSLRSPIKWDVPQARRPEAPRFCSQCGQPTEHEWVQWYTEAYRRSFRVLNRCDAHAPRIEIIDHELEAFL